MMANPLDKFAALVSPVQDMAAVRDRRRTGVLYVDIDLSVARSLAAGSALTLPINGTIIYVDQRANTGYAVVHVQDETFSIANTPITVFAGFILQAPFTQLVIENAAQPGQTLRILYGVDISFTPGTGAGVTVVNPVNVLDRIEPSCGTNRNDLATAVAANIVTTLLAPAANPRGVRLRHLVQSIQPGAGGTITQWIVASVSAPASIATKANTVQLALAQNTAAALLNQGGQAINREIPPSWGIYAVHTITVAVALSNSVYWSAEVL